MTHLEFFNKLDKTYRSLEEMAFKMTIEEVQEDARKNIDRGRDYYELFNRMKEWLKEEKEVGE